MNEIVKYFYERNLLLYIEEYIPKKEVVKI